MTCSVEGCAKAVGTRGWCPMHYQRWRKYGTTDDRPGTHEPERRFWVYVAKTDDEGCWLWKGETIHSGYGRMWLAGKRRQMAHRFAYELLVGPIPEGHHLHHRCQTPACVNPAHLEIVTPAAHLRLGPTFQARNAAKTHCDSGHEFTPENTYRPPTGGRRCRACHRRWSREYQERRQLAAVSS